MKTATPHVSSKKPAAAPKPKRPPISCLVDVDGKERWISPPLLGLVGTTIDILEGLQGQRAAWVSSISAGKPQGFSHGAIEVLIYRLLFAYNRGGSRDKDLQLEALRAHFNEFRSGYLRARRDAEQFLNSHTDISLRPEPESSKEAF